MRYRDRINMTPEQLLTPGTVHPKWGVWGEAHCLGYHKVLEFYLQHQGSISGPPPKEVFMPVGTKVEITGDTEVAEGTTGWIREISADGWTAWVSRQYALYDGSEPWGIWCSWSVLEEVDG